MRHRLIREMYEEIAAKDSSLYGEMALCLDDPLRDTPEKAEQYVRIVMSLDKAQRDRATEADVAAALRLLAAPDPEPDPLLLYVGKRLKHNGQWYQITSLGPEGTIAEMEPVGA
jgi:hypothetical protein